VEGFDRSFVPRKISAPPEPGGERIKRVVIGEEPRGVDPALCRSRRGGRASRAIADELALGCDPDILEFVRNGGSIARWLEPTGEEVTLSNFSQTGYDLSATFSLLGDRDFQFRIPMERCAMVRDIGIEFVGAGVGTGRARIGTLDKSGAFVRRVGGGPSSADFSLFLPGPFWVPPGEGMIIRCTYTGPGGPGNEISGTVSAAVYQFRAGVFPLCC